jgi:hypothetical protein
MNGSFATSSESHGGSVFVMFAVDISEKRGKQIFDDGAKRDVRSAALRQ